ncbi:Coproporphyrinogen-III oxidase, partial [Kickxella alabastrina]
ISRCYSTVPPKALSPTSSGYSLIGCIGVAAATGAAGLYLGTQLSGRKQPQTPSGAALGSEVNGLQAPASIPNTDYENEPKPGYYTEDDKPMHERMECFVLDLQDRLVTALESLEPSKKFLRDRWQREDGKGYGISCVLQDGVVYEKAGVNVSVIEGTLTAGQLKSMRDRNPQTAQKLDVGEEYDFRVAGVSVVVHPRNPYAPTAHKNYRRFELYRKSDKAAGPVMAWFGGGADLTPAYLFEDDV